MPTGIETLQTILQTISENAASLGPATSTPQLQANGYAVALTLLTGSRWISAYDSAKLRYSVYPSDLPSVRKWVQEQAAKSTAVNVQWIPAAMPLILKTALPVAGGVFLGGLIFGTLLK